MLRRQIQLEFMNGKVDCIVATIAFGMGIDKADIRQLPLKTLLVYLEMAGIITPAYSYYADYHFKFVIEKRDILVLFNAERRPFLEQLFACAPLARS